MNARQITQEELKTYLNYDPDTGKFTNLIGRGNIGAGCIVGHTHSDGYLQMSVGGVHRLAHHWAWLYMTGEFPPSEKEVDHINMNRADNRWANLRIATKSQNLANQYRKRELPKGVYRYGRQVGYTATIRKDGVLHRLGTFDKVEDAQAAYNSAAISLHNEYARTGSV